MTRLILAVNLLCICAVPCLAGEALELKGLMPGLTMEQVRAMYPTLGCRDSAADGLPFCFYQKVTYPEPVAIKDLDSIGGAPTSYWQVYFSPNQTIAGIAIVMHSWAFGDVVEAAKTKNGPATKVTNSIVQNAFGAKFTNPSVLWRRRDNTLVIQKYSGDRDTMTVTLENSKGMRERNEYLSQQARKSKPDM